MIEFNCKHNNVAGCCRCVVIHALSEVFAELPVDASRGFSCAICITRTDNNLVASLRETPGETATKGAGAADNADGLHSNCFFLLCS